MNTAEKPPFSGPESDPGEADNPAQRRISPRRRVLKKGVLGIGGQFAAQPCVVRNMSETGARIEFTGLLALPRNVTLHIETDGFKVMCETVWQRPPYAGLRFIGDKETTALARRQVVGMSERAAPEETGSAEDIPETEHQDPGKTEEIRPTENIDFSTIDRRARYHPFGKRH